MSKDMEFWKFLEEFDFISLCETWIDEKGWNFLKGKLPRLHDWECSFAVKEKRKGRFDYWEKKGMGENEQQADSKRGGRYNIIKN